MILQPTWGGVVRAASFYGMIALLPATAVAVLAGIWAGAAFAAGALVLATAPLSIAKLSGRPSITIDEEGLVIRGALGATTVRWDDVERVERRGPGREQVWIWPRRQVSGRRPDQVVVTPYLYSRSAAQVHEIIGRKVAAAADASAG